MGKAEKERAAAVGCAEGAAQAREYFAASVETYGFLSKALFREMNDEAIAQLAACEWPRDTGDVLLDRGYALVRRYFKFASTDPRTQLAVDYARIFLAAGVHNPQARTAVPYESVFTSEEHLMMSASRDDVVRRFREDGFKVNPDLHEPEDHIAFELEYLEHMSARALRAVESGDFDAVCANARRQVAFIDEHLLNWVPELLVSVEEYAKTAFYIGMLTIVEGALHQSRDFLQDMLDARENPDDIGLAQEG